EAKAGAGMAAVPASLTEATIRAARPVLSHFTGAASVATTPVASIAQGVIQAMFWSRIRNLVVASLVAGSVATGSFVALSRGQESTRADPRTSKQGGVARPDEKAIPEPVRIRPEDPPALSDRTQSRIVIARQIRDHYYRLYQAGEVDLDAYLRWQMRFA